MAKLLPKLALVIIIVIVLSFLGQAIFDSSYKFPKNLNLGVTFSSQYAKYLGLDWKKVFISSLDDLKIKDFRIPTYWEDIESQKNKFKFDDIDFILSELSKRGAKAILVLGARQPRWPECHYPVWIMGLSLSQRQKQTLDFIKRVVERYKENPSIWAYQVENEPFLPFFGENCDKGDRKFLEEEVNIVRNISKKPIIISDSGELGFWITAMQTSDIFGTTLYRDVYNPLMGYISYPILPFLYNLKSQVVKGIFAPKNIKTIIVELQAEPWIGTADVQRDPVKQTQIFPIKKMENYLDYAKKTGFDTAYLWGAEWWYFMEKMGHPEYLEYAKQLFH